ncbi:MBL fold metallo-hydrolase [Cryptosporangium minutisporangium]
MTVIELLPTLHMVEFPVGHAYLWIGSDGVTVVDSGRAGSAPAIAAAIRSLGHEPSDVRRLLLTHHHEDHVGSAPDIVTWGDVTVYAHRADAPVIRGEQPGLLPRLADWERPLYEQVTSGLPPGGPAPVAVDHELEDGETVDLGGSVATAVAVPGHTLGSVAFYLPESRVLFTGDTIARVPDGRVMLGVFNVDPQQAVASLARQARLDVDLACFGHGAPLTENATATLRSVAAAS